MNRKNIVIFKIVAEKVNCFLFQMMSAKEIQKTAIPKTGDGLIFTTTKHRLKRVAPNIPPRKDRTVNKFLSKMISARMFDINTAKANCNDRR